MKNDAELTVSKWNNCDDIACVSIMRDGWPDGHVLVEKKRLKEFIEKLNVFYKKMRD